MTDEEFENLKQMLETAPRVEIDGKAIKSMEIIPIEFLYNGKVIMMTGTRVVMFDDGTEIRYPITYDSLVASLQHVPQQFGPPDEQQS